MISLKLQESCPIIILILSLIHIASFEQYLEGAECIDAPVVRDGNIITGMGPGAAMEFALTIVDLLVGREKVDELVEAM